MQASPAACERILAAFEALVAEEGAVLRAGDFAAVRALQDQAEPLIAYLAEHADLVRMSGLGFRLVRVYSLREDNSRWLEAEVQRNRAELRELSGHQRTVARVAPAYAGPAAGAPRVSLVG